MNRSGVKKLEENFQGNKWLDAIMDVETFSIPLIKSSEKLIMGSMVENIWIGWI